MGVDESASMTEEKEQEGEGEEGDCVVQSRELA